MTVLLANTVGTSPDGPDTVLPLTAAQSGMWYAQSLDPLSPAQNTAECLEIDGPLDQELFAGALRQVIAETDALRVRVEDGPEGPRQTVALSAALPLTVHDLRDVPDADGQAEAWMRADLAEPCDLAVGPLFRHALFRVGQERWLWYQRIHHLVMDGFGYSLLVRRTAEVYSALVRGQDPGPRTFGTLSRPRRAGRRVPVVGGVRGGPRPLVRRLRRPAGGTPAGGSRRAAVAYVPAPHRPPRPRGHRPDAGARYAAPRHLAGGADRRAGPLHLTRDGPLRGGARAAHDGPGGIGGPAGAGHGDERAAAPADRHPRRELRGTGAPGRAGCPRGPPPSALPLRGHPPRPAAARREPGPGGSPRQRDALRLRRRLRGYSRPGPATCPRARSTT